MPAGWWYATFRPTSSLSIWAFLFLPVPVKGPVPLINVPALGPETARPCGIWEVVDEADKAGESRSRLLRFLSEAAGSVNDMKAANEVYLI